MTFECKECKFLLEWPANWKPKQRPIESELKKEHTWKRCQKIQNPTVKSGWIKKICELCCMETWFSKKHYTEITAVCEICN